MASSLNGAFTAERMKMKMREQHIVPLASQAVAILKDLQPITGPEGYVFPLLRDAQPSHE